MGLRRSGIASRSATCADEYGYSSTPHTRWGFYRVLANVFALICKCVRIEDPNFRKAFLPERRLDPEFLPCTNSKSPLDELNRFFNRRVRIDSQENMKMIGHDDKLVQKVFAPLPIRIERPDEKFRSARGL